MIRYNAPKIKAQSTVVVQGRRVGHVIGDTFQKTACGSKHMLRSPRGWASDVAALNAAQAAGATQIEITDTETGMVYRAAISDMLTRGTKFDRGFGKQVVLPLDQWRRQDQGEQLALFIF